jgi:hypothetical protein
VAYVKREWVPLLTAYLPYSHNALQQEAFARALQDARVPIRGVPDFKSLLVDIVRPFITPDYFHISQNQIFSEEPPPWRRQFPDYRNVVVDQIALQSAVERMLSVASTAGRASTRDVEQTLRAIVSKLQERAGARFPNRRDLASMVRAELSGTASNAQFEKAVRKLVREGVLSGKAGNHRGKLTT